MYDTSRYDGGTRWDKVKRGKAGLYNAQANTIGKLLLQARRLCEAGCGYVTIHASYAGVWDMHADGNNLNMTDGMEAVGCSFDHAVAAFIRDCEERGLSDKILLVCCGEVARPLRMVASSGETCSVNSGDSCSRDGVSAPGRGPWEEVGPPSADPAWLGPVCPSPVPRLPTVESLIPCRQQE